MRIRTRLPDRIRLATVLIFFCCSLVFSKHESVIYRPCKKEFRWNIYCLRIFQFPLCLCCCKTLQKSNFARVPWEFNRWRKSFLFFRLKKDPKGVRLIYWVFKSNYLQIQKFKLSQDSWTDYHIVGLFWKLVFCNFLMPISLLAFKWVP